MRCRSGQADAGLRLHPGLRRLTSSDVFTLVGSAVAFKQATNAFDPLHFASTHVVKDQGGGGLGNGDRYA